VERACKKRGWIIGRYLPHESKQIRFRDTDAIGPSAEIRSEGRRKKMSIPFIRSRVLWDVWFASISELLQALFLVSRRRQLMLASTVLALGLPAIAVTATPAPVTQWHSGLIELDRGWLAHEGDQIEWSSPEFDDSGWTTADLENMGPAQQGWHWYRRRVQFRPGQQEVRLLISGGNGTYELFVNGIRLGGPTLRSALLVGRPVEAVFPVSDADGTFEIALRTRIPSGYAAWHLPQFTNVTMGIPPAIEYERQALESQRLDGLAPALCINFLLCLAGISALVLFALQQAQPEYMFLGLYLLLVGISDGLSILQSSGFVPLSANFLIADPLIYAWVIVQIEFTHSFAGRRVHLNWRIYEAALLAPLTISVLTWFGLFASDTYVLIEAAATAPVGLLLSVLLFMWYRQGNREAGWLILPSLAPAVSTALFDLGTAAITLGWQPLIFLVNPIRIGPIGLQLVDLGTILFLFSIAALMFSRFARVTREEARAAAELASAREIQQHLVPAVLPLVPHYAIEAAYLPAREVGGDFFQVLPRTDGSVVVVIGDVSGKGLRAAMTGAFAIGALHALAAEIPDPPQLLSRLNRELLGGQPSGFVTCLCIKISPDGQLRISNAGHLSPYKNGEELISEGGPPLGLFPDLIYSESRFEIDDGDTLTLLSDGVVEARNETDEEFGFERTKALSNGSAHNLAAAAQQFGQEDDITVVKVTLTPIEICTT
jgi:hypothetical protein